MPLKADWVSGNSFTAAALNAIAAAVNTLTDTLTTGLAGKQASDADLTAIAGLSPANDDVIQRKSGAWTNRTIAQLKTDLALGGGGLGDLGGLVTDWGFSVGYDVVNLGDEDLEGLYLKAARLGASRIRVIVSPHNVGDGPYDWTDVDRQVDLAEAMGLTPHMLLEGPRNVGGTAFLVADPEDMGALAAAAAARYIGRCSVWQVLNEQNHFNYWGGVLDVASYAEVLEAVSTAIRAVQPESTIVVGGLTSANTFDHNGTDFPGVPEGVVTMSPVDFITELYAEGAKDFFDAVAVHPYTLESGIDPEAPVPSAESVAFEREAEVYDVMVANGDVAKRIWWTEFGFPTTSDDSALGYQISHEDQVTYIRAVMRLAMERPWVGPILLYSIQDLASGPNPEHNYGVFEDGGEAKDAAEWLPTIRKSAPYGLAGGGAGGGVDDLSDLGVTATASELNVLDGITATTTELNYVDGVTSNVQTQLNAKVTSGGALGTPSSGTLTNCTFPTLNQNTTGSAATLTTGRNVQTNLASTSAASFNGSANITPGVTGTLPVGNGGTGATTLTGLVKGNGTSAMSAATAGTDYVAPSLVDAKGDLLAGTADNTIGRVAVGDPNRVLYADPSAAAGVAWGAKVPLKSKFRPTSDEVMPVGAGHEITSLTITGSAPSYGAMQYYAANSGRFRVGGSLTDIGGGVRYNAINTASSGWGFTSYEYEFYCTGPKLSLHLYSYGETDFKILVDGKHVRTRNWMTSGAVSGNVFVTLTFNTTDYLPTAVHRVRVLMGALGFIQCLTDSDGQIFPAEPRPKWLMTGDSWAHGTGATSEGGIQAGTLAGRFALHTGFEVWNYAQGGTGLQNPGPGSGATFATGKYGSSTRLAAYAAMTNVAGMVVVGGGNDGALGTFPVATSRTEMTALVTALKSYHPNAPLFWFGVESGVYPSISADLDTLNTGLLAEAATTANKARIHKYVDCRTSPWVTGTGHLTSWVGDGNADFFVATESPTPVHPSHGGWEYHTTRFIQEIQDVIV